MKIENVRINGFGNIEEKDIDLIDGINLIHGNNESGKSTFLKFIVSMFYGISKNKRGKTISDIDRYRPWKAQQFSGKITYQLSNNKKYEVYRDFLKRNPKIYNENIQDISDQFSIDKNKGSQFFYEQTNIEEDTFLSSTISMQQEVKINKQEQENIIQKISNLASTGNDSVSFKKCMNSLNKKQLEEVGTQRSQDRPMNKIENRIQFLEKEKARLMWYQEEKYTIEEQKNVLKEEIQKEEENIAMLQFLKQQEAKQRIQREKISINEEINQKYSKKIEILKQERIEQKEEMNDVKKQYKKKKVNYPILLILLSLLLLVNIVGMLTVKNILVMSVLFLIDLIYVVISGRKIWKIQKDNRKIEINIEEQKKSHQSQIDKIDQEIEIIQKAKVEKDKEIQSFKDLLNQEQEKISSKIEPIYPNSKMSIEEQFSTKALDQQLEQVLNQHQESKVAYHELELDEKNILPQLDNLVSIEEELEALYEQRENLKFKEKCIMLAKEVMQSSYDQMKENVTPKFTKELSNAIMDITGGKYKRVRFNSEEGLMVELSTGEYIDAELLSIGTIDQLYLSLRLAIKKEMETEKLPLILDEAFAYYDDTRLEDSIRFLSEKVDSQIILLTCTNRERKILEQLHKSYQYIEL